MIARFEIIGSGSPRPDAERIIFCDGSGGGLFRPETDLELSHWRPTRTPAEYRAGTSTEICYRFLDDPRPGEWTAAVNNHLDVDGILSVYVLVHSDHARAHRRTIIEAAEMGDFWGWGEPPAQRLFQGLTWLMERQRRSGVEPRVIYAEAFGRMPGLIDGTDPQSSGIDESLEPLRTGLELVEQAQIARSLIGRRCAHYVIPSSVAGPDLRRAHYVPGFNEAISAKALLWPQVRARQDAERACLVSVERPPGWSHDLWFPGYLWADTAGLWQVPGMTYHDGMESYELNHPGLSTAFAELQDEEPAPGSWTLGGDASPIQRQMQGLFPLVGRFVDESGESAVSGLTPERVARALGGVFD